MRQRNPEIPVSSLPIVEKLARTRRADLVGAYALATTLALLFPYSYDVAVNRLEDTDATPTIRTIVDAPKNAQQTSGITYYLNGFDTSNADTATKTLTPAFAQISADTTKSFDYGNASIDSNKLADLVVADLKNEGKNEASFVLNSASGITGAEMVLKIIKTTSIKVEVVYDYETPDGIDGLLPGTKKDLTLMQDAITALPGAEDSSYVRDALTLIVDGDGGSRWTNPNKTMYDNVLSFFETAESAIKQTREKKRPRVELMNNYGWIIANADLAKTFQDIGELQDEKYMPSFVYMRSTNPPNVVDTERSSKNICEYARKALLNCFIFDVDSEFQRHTSFHFDTEANVTAVALGKEALLASIKQNRETYKTNTSSFARSNTMIAE